jgi:hypothetical protein
MTIITTAYVMNSKRSDVLTQQLATILPALLMTMDLVRMIVTDVQTHLLVTLTLHLLSTIVLVTSVLVAAVLLAD